MKNKNAKKLSDSNLPDDIKPINNLSKVNWFVEKTILFYSILFKN